MFDDKKQEMKDKVAELLTEDLSKITGIPKAAIWVMFEDVPAKDWYINGKCLAEK